MSFQINFDFKASQLLAGEMVFDWMMLDCSGQPDKRDRYGLLTILPLTAKCKIQGAKGGGKRSEPGSRLDGVGGQSCKEK